MLERNEVLSLPMVESKYGGMFIIEAEFDEALSREMLDI